MKILVLAFSLLLLSFNSFAQTAPPWLSAAFNLYSSTSFVGPRAAVTKNVSSLVGVQGISVNNTAKRIEVRGSNIVLSGIDLSGYEVFIYGSNVIVRDCLFTEGPKYNSLRLMTSAVNTLVEHNEFRGLRKGGLVSGAIYIQGTKGTGLTNGARNTIVRRNHISGYPADGIKVLSSPTLIEENVIEVNAFSVGSHGDQISIQITKGAWSDGNTVIVRGNYISQLLTPDHWRYASSARFGGTDTGKGGPNNSVRIAVNANDSVSAINNVLVTENVLQHDPYLKSFTYQSTYTRATNIQVTDNAWAYGLNKKYAYPNSNISLWSANIDMTSFVTISKP